MTNDPMTPGFFLFSVFLIFSFNHPEN